MCRGCSDCSTRLQVVPVNKPDERANSKKNRLLAPVVKKGCSAATASEWIQYSRNVGPGWSTRYTFWDRPDCIFFNMRRGATSLASYRRKWMSPVLESSARCLSGDSDPAVQARTWWFVKYERPLCWATGSSVIAREPRRREKIQLAGLEIDFPFEGLNW